MNLTTRAGSDYRLLLRVPDQPAPAGGFPVIVLVDGHALFATAQAAVQLQAGRPDATGVCHGVLIGIGYPGGAPFDAERRQHDLLPGPGGADRFLDDILERMLPAVASRVPLNGTRRALIGHSFGGLFALHTLFTRSNAFEAIIAGSPSIWWNERAILRTEERYRLDLPSRTTRLLVTVGEDEQDGAVSGDLERAARLARARMRDNAAEMVQRLQAAGQPCAFTVFAGENHASVIPAMLSRAIAFAFGKGDGRTAAAA